MSRNASLFPLLPKSMQLQGRFLIWSQSVSRHCWRKRNITTDKYCKKCQFPASLPPEVKIRGRNGVYEVDNYIGIRGTGRIYSATKLTDGESFLLKEYVIPKKYFNEQETRACKRNFETSSELKLSDGRKQDSRLITPIEAIADAREERCYVILQKNDEAIALAEQQFQIQNGNKQYIILV